jgi:sarcosine oxidase
MVSGTTRRVEKHECQDQLDILDALRKALHGRNSLEADAVIWACGPWMSSVFPGLIELRVTKQDVTFFGADATWRTPPVPGWVDYDEAMYGLGDLDGRGVKCAPNEEGERFDPDRGERRLSAQVEERARDYLAHRFPSLAGAPLIGSRTCQYTLTADTVFVLAPHPTHQGVWLAGGGSGHGFKHGPVVGTYVADLVEGRQDPDPRFGLGPRVGAAGLRAAAQARDRASGRQG